jgi:hypothetical protein
VKYLFLPLMLVFALRGGVALADDQPTPTEPVTGSIDHEPSQTGTAPASGEPSHEAALGKHGQAAAGHGSGHGGIDAKTLALQFLNFGALLFILIYFGGRAFSKALRNRHNQLKAEIDSAASQKALAQQRFQEQESRLANLEQELAGRLPRKASARRRASCRRPKKKPNASRTRRVSSWTSRSKRQSCGCAPRWPAPQ